MDNLFKNSAERWEPLAKRIAPESLKDFFGQDKILGKTGALKNLIEKDRMMSAIFYGPAGCGKSALARIIANRTESDLVRLNAVIAKIEDLRSAFFRARQNRTAGRRTILFIDEIHRFNKLQQDGLLPALEEGVVTLIGTTTRNPFYSLIPPLRSRVLLFEFEKLDSKALEGILQAAKERESIEITKEANAYLIRFANGDARKMINLLETAHTIKEEQKIELQDVEGVIKEQHLLYDRDEDYHYDIISAFIKSVRGSDPDAALYWLAVMLEGGEDPLYIARRLIILASEDIGLADSLSLPVARAAYDACEKIGMPEARIILSHAALYLSLQPKSNSSCMAIDKAQRYVKTHEQLKVPPWLRSSPGAQKEYKYPHDHRYHFVRQDYLGKKIRFYTPGILGEERELGKRLSFLQKLEEASED